MSKKVFILIITKEKLDFDMNNNFKQKLHETIETIFEKSNGCKLDDTIFVKLEDENAFIADFLGIKSKQAFFISVLFTLNLRTPSVVSTYLQNHFDCSPIRLLKYRDLLVELQESKHIKIGNSSDGTFTRLKAEIYTINRLLNKSMMSGKKLDMDIVFLLKSDFDILNYSSIILEERSRNQCSLEYALNENQRIIYSFDSPFISTIKEMKMNTVDLFFYFVVIYTYYNHSRSISPRDFCSNVFDDSNDKFNFLQTLINGNNDLFKYDLLSINETEYLDELKIGISKKTKDILKDCGLLLLPEISKNEYAFGI